MGAKEHTCCFIGHRKIDITRELINRLEETIKHLITEKKVDTFLFGSKSEFDILCLKVLTELKKNYSHITRVYVRSEFAYIDDSYTEYILKTYDETYFPMKLINAGRAVYVERNFEMIDKSAYCVFYYDKNYSQFKRKSGTKLAYDYATKKALKIINLY